MQGIAYFKKVICYLFVFCIALTGMFSVPGQTGTFPMHEKQAYQSAQSTQASVKESDPAEKSQHYLQMIQTSFAKEDCRIEDGSAATMQKLNLLREQKSVSYSKLERICFCLTDCYAKCACILHHQYIQKAAAIRDVHQKIVAYMHRKDGQKNPVVFLLTFLSNKK